MSIKNNLFQPFDPGSKESLAEILSLRGKDQEILFEAARQVREESFGKKVEVRSVIEYSNICFQECQYCGMQRQSDISRYVLTEEEFCASVDTLYSKGRKVVLIQSGENPSDPFFKKIFSLLSRVKKKYPDLVLFCCLGNLPAAHYARLREIGVERYLIKFETANPALYQTIKPLDTLENRLGCIEKLKELGFWVSSGNITGLPGQSLEDLADDLLLVKELDLPMTSTSPFIPNDMSVFAREPMADLDLTLNVMALMRIMNPKALIPTTSALELLAEGGQYLGLMAGANTITLHDATPQEKEDNYVIYKKERHRPHDSLFELVQKAGMECASKPLVV